MLQVQHPALLSSPTFQPQPESSTGYDSLFEKIVNAVRTTVLTKRVRVSEFFQDFDRLRSGYITSKFY